MKLGQKKKTTRKKNQSEDKRVQRDTQFDDCESDVLRSYSDKQLHSRSLFYKQLKSLGSDFARCVWKTLVI